MGRDLLAAAHAHPAKITPAERVVLERMALTALDKQTGARPACLYFAGHGPLALVLGRDWPADGDTSASATATRAASSQAVGRALRALKNHGLIELGNVARHGRRQEYRLLLTLNPHVSVKPVENSGRPPPLPFIT
jgi:hypothetical protein